VTAYVLQVAHLGQRSIMRTARQPANIVFALVFPLALMLVNAGGLEPATAIPSFPAESFLAFALAVPFVQGALFSTMNAGTDLARDIQTGFLDRLGLTPMRGSALIAGQLVGVVALGVAQGLVYITAGLIAGVEIETGLGGAVAILVLAALYALGFGAIGTLLALRTGSGEAIQGYFPFLFALLFVSSMNMPRDLIEVDWFQTVAGLNPVSYMLEGVRVLIIDGWDSTALALSVAISVSIAVIGLAGSALALKTRLTRT
jgi:ABC-2 type transport system permease protein